MRLIITPSALAVKTLLFSLTSVSTVLFSHAVLADEYAKDIAELEVITITNQRHQRIEHLANDARGKTSVPDLAHWLTSVPGANINSNGPITGIAQYRGLYGDRVATSIDGHPVIGAGPNAMDTPLSYTTPLIVDSMTVYRGVAPVSVAINTLGGAVAVNMRKAEIMHSQKTTVNGDIQAGYRSNNKAKTLSAVTNIAKEDIALLLYGNSQTGDSMKSGDNVVISPTDFDKVQLGGDIRYGQDHNTIGLSYHYTDTGYSGTPALPMDIEYIKSHRVTLDGNFTVEQWQGEWLLGYIDADHEMTNFLMRQNNNPTRHRRNKATAETSNFKLQFSKEFDFGEILFGADGYFASHDSVISNPNNMMFNVVNFNNVTDERLGVFTQWQQQFQHTQLQLGLRLKRANSDADQVSTSMSMMNNMMGQMASNLQSAFNTKDSKTSDNNIDIALNTQTKLSENTSISVGLGIKSRAPSYQERYLWTPMEATGGLADGHTYIGDIDLKSETAYQIDLGVNYKNNQFKVAPHIFYQAIDDYIQGTPLTMQDMPAQMMASMMAGDNNPLKFSNVDAKLYGIDLNASYRITDNIELFSIVSYVQGERRDIDDNLYRIAPLNGQIKVSYSVESWIINTQLSLTARQNKVSSTNTEQKTSGYGVVNIDAQYYVNNDLTLRIGVDNLLDKDYQDHLGGYNRVSGSGIALMSRLPKEGLSAWAEATYSF